MKILYLLVFVFVISIFKLFGQVETKEFGEADNLFSNSRFAAATPYYLNFLKGDPSNTTLNFKTGICYLHSRSQKLKAVEYLEKAVANTSHVIAYKFLGDAYHLSNKYDLAIVAYEKFKKLSLANKPKDQSNFEEVNWKIKMCKIGEKLRELDINQKDSNSNYINYTSSLSLDQSTMTYTFHGPDGIRRKLTEDEKYFEGMFIPVKIGLPHPPKVIVDTTTNTNEASVATSVDGHIVLTYKNDQGDANLYLSRLVGNQWTSPEKLNKSINLKGWEPNEWISTDGYTLYFTSSRAGGFGGKDIYTCKKLPNGEWGKATNLGPLINTSFDEEAPFIYSDGFTLFFSSNKNKQSCCFDIFRSTLSNDGNWTEPIKVGYPVKTSTDDILYATTTAYQEYSPAAINAGVYNKEDLYVATFIDQNKNPFTILKGKVMDIYGKVPRSVKITVSDNETAEVLGVYNSHYKTGDYILILPPGRNNNITYEADGYLFQSENMNIGKKSSYYEIHKVVKMPPVTSGSKIVLNNIFFDFDRATLRSVSNVELNKLFILLSMNPKMAVELFYYIDNKENNKYNIKLAQDRAQAVVNYLIEKGIHTERIIVKEYEKIKVTKQKSNHDKKNTLEEEQLSQRLELKITNIK